MLTRLFLLIMAAALAACATATPYQPLGKSGGYSEQRLESNRFQVRFLGNSVTSRELVQNYLLYRAAELTLANGHDYFVALERRTDADTVKHQSYSFGTGFGRWYWYPLGGVGVTTTTATRSFMAEATIRTFAGPKPADDPAAFDARELRANLMPVILRPEAADQEPAPGVD